MLAFLLLSVKVIASDILIDLLLEVMSVRPSTKSLSDFALIWCVGRPQPDMRSAHQYDLDPIQGQGHGASEVLKIAENRTFLRPSPPLFRHGAQN